MTVPIMKFSEGDLWLRGEKDNWYYQTQLEAMKLRQEFVSGQYPRPDFVKEIDAALKEYDAYYEGQDA